MKGQNTKVGPDSGADHEPLQGVRPETFTRLAWLPIPLLAAAIIVGRMAGLSETYKSETLTLLLSFTFYTLVSLGTIFLIGRSFLALGTPGLLLLECGVILWSLAGTVGDAVSHGDANVNVTIFNTGILLAGLCHLAGAILSLRPQRALRATPLWLGAATALALGALWLVTQAALANWLPVFFIPGQGGTLVRYSVLISATAMFVISAGLLLSSWQAPRAPFISWYALALLLLAVGLFGVMIQLSLGSAVNWLGRTAQWLGGVYLLLAATATLRESHLPLLPPETTSRPVLYRDAMAIVIVLAAAAVRLVFLSALGTRAPYVVFFPAVMFAAIYGGGRAGLLATVLSAILAGYFWIEPVVQVAPGLPADWLGLAIFLLSGSMIALIAEALRKARARASAAETQALLAAEREAAADVLRKSEERYHTLFNTMDEGFCVIETIFDAEKRPADYRFLEVNAAFEKQTGLHDAEGKLIRSLAPDHVAHWFEIYGKIALTGEPAHFVNEAKALNRWYDVHAYRVGKSEDGQVAIIFNDITELKQTQEALQKAHDELERRVEERTKELRRAYESLKQETNEREQAESQLRQAHKMEALGTLAGGIAHDFNNLLGAVIGFAELLQEDLPLGNPGHRHVARVMEAGMRGRDLVKQMLTYSRKTEHEKKPLRLSSIVKESIRLLRASIPTTITINVNVTSESGLIMADPVQIQQVVMNLSTNAYYAMREKGGTLTIELSDFSVGPSNGHLHGIEPGLYMKLTVRDTGIGIPAQIKDRIFDPFFTTKAVGEGTGLGLSVVMGIIKQSGGHITVDSEQGRGSTFTVYFRKVRERSEADAANKEEALPTGSERILFVDDEEALLEMGEELLTKLGYEVTTQGSSSAALTLIEENPSRFDLVITDQTMPDMTGVELAGRILAIRSDMPVIICTGFSHLVDAESASTAGVKGFAMKPLTKREIARTIREVLDG